MARNILIENDRTWYLRVRYRDPLTGRTKERKEPCGGFGAPTPETVALVLKIAELASLEGETRKREGRPTKHERCERCDGAMVIHGAPAGSVAVGAPIVAGAAPVAAADLPLPSEFVTAHVVRPGHAPERLPPAHARRRGLPATRTRVARSPWRASKTLGRATRASLRGRSARESPGKCLYATGIDAAPLKIERQSPFWNSLEVARGKVRLR